MGVACSTFDIHDSGFNLLTHAEGSHDVGLVDRRHAAPLVVPGVLKGVLRDTSAGVLCDQFDALNDAVYDLQHARQEIHHTDRTRATAAAGLRSACSL